MKIVIAYIPVVHQGYLDFISKVQPDALYILGEEFYRNFRPIEKDIRKLKPETVVAQLKVSGTEVKNIQVLTKERLSFWNNPPAGGEVIESPGDPIAKLQDDKLNMMIVDSSYSIQYTVFNDIVIPSY